MYLFFSRLMRISQEVESNSKVKTSYLKQTEDAMSQDDIRQKLLQRFKQEADTHLMLLQRRLVDLEADPTNEAFIKDIFRAAHTIKGNSRMMNFRDITSVAHNLETLFGEMRDSGLRLTPAASELIFETVEHLTGLVDAVLRGEKSPLDVADLNKKLEQILVAAPKPQAIATLPSLTNLPIQKPIAEKEAPAPSEEETRHEMIADLKDAIDQDLLLLQRQLVDLEREPTNEDFIKEAYHSIHTIAANAKMISIPGLEGLMQQMLTVFSGLQEGALEFNPKLNDMLFEAADIIAQVVDAVARGAAPTVDAQSVTRQLYDFCDHYQMPGSSATSANAPKTTLGGQLYPEILRYLYEATAPNGQRVAFSCTGGEIAASLLTLEALKADVFKKFFGLWMGKPVLQVALRGYIREGKLALEMVCNGELFELEKPLTT